MAICGGLNVRSAATRMAGLRCALSDSRRSRKSEKGQKQTALLDARHGSLAEIATSQHNVRFTPMANIERCIAKHQEILTACYPALRPGRICQDLSAHFRVHVLSQRCEASYNFYFR